MENWLPLSIYMFGMNLFCMFNLKSIILWLLESQDDTMVLWVQYKVWQNLKISTQPNLKWVQWKKPQEIELIILIMSPIVLIGQ